MDYVTNETVTTELDDVNWAATGNATQAVLLANAWLNGKQLGSFEIVPKPILAAGAYIAQEVIAGNLYQGRKDGLIVSKSVKAGPVSSSKTYASGVDGQALSAGESMALALITPYITTAPLIVELGRY